MTLSQQKIIEMDRRPSNRNMKLILLLLLTDFGGCSVLYSSFEHVKLKQVGPESVNIRHGGQLELTCSATGSPAPNVSWYKNGLFVFHEPDTSLTSGSSSLGETIAKLRIPCISEADAGQYECRAVSGHHQESHVTTVKVVDADDSDTDCIDTADTDITMWRPTVMTPIGHTVVLPCRVSQPDSVNTQWTRDGGDDMSDDHFHVSDQGDLVISHVSWSHMGQYTCKVTNMRTARTSSKTSFLYPMAS